MQFPAYLIKVDGGGHAEQIYYSEATAVARAAQLARITGKDTIVFKAHTIARVVVPKVDPIVNLEAVVDDEPDKLTTG